MVNRQDASIERLQSACNTQEALAHLTDCARALDFEYCAYGLQARWPFTCPHTKIFSNYPQAWQTRYTKQQYLASDPTVRHAQTSLDPLIWSDTTFATTPVLWDEAQSIGLRIGWVQGIHGVGNKGMLTLARAHEPLSPAELRNKASYVIWLTQIMHRTVMRLLLPDSASKDAPVLTDREIEVLRWTGDGKSAGETAAILQITERTVHFHIQSVMAKLGAANKTAAVVQAAMLGLLR